MVSSDAAVDRRHHARIVGSAYSRANPQCSNSLLQQLISRRAVIPAPENEGVLSNALAHTHAIRGHLPVRVARSQDHVILFLRHVDLVRKAARFQTQSRMCLIASSAASCIAF